MIHMQIESVSLSVLPPDHMERHHFQITVENRGGKYAVMHMGWCLGADGEWEFEPNPSSRGEGWIAAHRYGYHEAITRAGEVAPDITVNGRTAAQIAAQTEVAS